MAFEVFHNKFGRTGSQLTVTITARGHLTLSRGALNALGDPDLVDLLFDRAERLIGIRRSENPDAYHVSKARSVNCKAFARAFEIDTKQARRRPAQIEGGMLVVDVKSSGTVVDSNRSGRSGPR
jgi:hypothetical protein